MILEPQVYREKSRHSSYSTTDKHLERNWVPRLDECLRRANLWYLFYKRSAYDGMWYADRCCIFQLIYGILIEEFSCANNMLGRIYCKG